MLKAAFYHWEAVVAGPLVQCFIELSMKIQTYIKHNYNIISISVLRNIFTSGLL